MAKKLKFRKFRTVRWLSPLRALNFALLFAIIGVLILAFSRAETILGLYGSIEQDQVNRINQTRANLGKGQLSDIECLNTIAEIHTQEMAASGTIWHTENPDFKQFLNPSYPPTLAGRIDALCGPKYFIAGENVGYLGSSESIYNAFLASKLHYNNIVNAYYGRVGVGAGYWPAHDSKGNNYPAALFVTQEFANCSEVCSPPWNEPARLPDDQIAPPSPGIYRENLRNSNSAGPIDIGYNFGNNGDKPVPCDWNGNGNVTTGVWRPNEATFYIRNTNTTGIADIKVQYGSVGDLPVCGDWDGNGIDTIGIYRPNETKFYLRNSNSTGTSNLSFIYGAKGDVPLAGDWDGNGTDTIGVYRPNESRFYLRNSNTPGFADIAFQYGNKGDVPLVGDWDGNGTDTIGLYRPNEAMFYLRNSNSTGSANIAVQFGNIGDIPVVGDWNIDNRTTIGIWRNL